MYRVSGKNAPQAVVSKKELMEKSINRIRKINPEWISFFQNTIQESVVNGTPVNTLVSREFKKASKIIKDMPDKKVTVAYIKTYAETHFDMKLK